MLSVGEILQKERERKNITLHSIEKKLRVRAKYLSAIEANDWTTFTSKIYIEGIIKNYSLHLGLDPERTLAFFKRDYASVEEVKFKKRVAHRYLTPHTRTVVGVILFLVSAIFIFYFGYQLKLYFTPPRIQLMAPQENSFKRADSVTIVGRVDRESEISIFGTRVYPDSQGVFRYNFPLKKGKNVFVVEVTGANGKKSSLTRTFVNSQ